jgi:hypothetical protein
MMEAKPDRDGLVAGLRGLGYQITQLEEGSLWYIHHKDQLIGILFGDPAAQKVEPNPWFADDQR